MAPDEIERLLSVCKDKMQLLADAYAHAFQPLSAKYVVDLLSAATAFLARRWPASARLDHPASSRLPSKFLAS